MTSQGNEVAWRASNIYLPTNASKAGLLEETRLFLVSLDEQGDIPAAHNALLAGGLGQRSRETRQGILTVLHQRLTRWKPPTWVLDDLIAFARHTDGRYLQIALLVHVVRQDALLYDFVQCEVVPRWHRGDHLLTRADVQRFLDTSLVAHPEIHRWSLNTRKKLAGNILSILRDYGLLRGKIQRQIIEPDVPADVVRHLVKLLHEEGISDDAIMSHPDWHIWLWDARRIQQALHTLDMQEFHR